MIVAGWLGELLGGLCALLFAWLLIRPHVLILDGSGFTAGGGLVRSPLKIAWRDVQGFHVRKQRRTKQIGFRFEPGARTRLNRRPGIELSLPGGWPRSTEKMVEILNERIDGKSRLSFTQHIVRIDEIDGTGPAR